MTQLDVLEYASGFNVENVALPNEVDPSSLSREEDWDLP